MDTPVQRNGYRTIHNKYDAAKKKEITRNTDRRRGNNATEKTESKPKSKTNREQKEET